MRSLNIKKSMVFVIVIALICGAFGIFAWHSDQTSHSNKVFAENGEQILTLQIGNPNMTINGVSQEIDPGMGTVPIVLNDRTMLPVRAVIEAVGGTVSWDENTQTATLEYNGDTVRLTIGSQTAYFNDAASELDVTPVIINDRTMLPIRFIAESFKFNVDWAETTQTVTITVPAAGENQTISEPTIAPIETLADAPTVYMTADITPESLMKIYDQLDFTPQGNVSIKLSTGEAGNTHYLDPNLIKDLVQSVEGTIVECNTAYGGSRSNTAMHRQVAADHGFTAIADVDIMDADGSIEIPVSDKAENITRDIVGKNYANYDSMIVLSHFKGHAMGGFGGAIKNTSIGVSSSEGKMYIHSGGHSTTSWSGGTQDQFLEAMAEAAQAVYNDRQNNGGIIYINVMNHLSVDCDCDGNPAKPDMHDIGILASYDPVALDQACVDLVYEQKDGDGKSLVERIESRNGLHTLEHAAKIGFGSREYNLVSIDN